jgi:hypothetical protein
VLNWSETAMNRVITKQVGKFVEIGQIVDRDQIYVLAVG